MIIGTAGHIDHGKSALVTALTGLVVDRLSEEKRRGITIELNFAPLVFPGLPPAGIVDVPGHEDFVRTMVAGATGIDLVLLVVDLAEGPRPQTEEHLTIVEQLRIPRGIPVFTKADLVEPEWTELVIADFAARLERSPVRFGEPAVVSAVTGRGIAELKERLRAEVAGERDRAKADLFRLPVDRAFSVAGVGTVITGTCWSGSVRPGDSIRILPRDLVARVRSVESYGEQRAEAIARTRTALGLVGIDRSSIGRGDVVVDPTHPWAATSAIDVEIDLVAEARIGRGARPRVRLHLGTAEVLARIHPRQPLAAGGRVTARLVLERPVIARGGDRFVIRAYSPVTTIGGGRVLDPLPERRAGWPPHLASEDPTIRITALAERRPIGLTAGELPIVLGLTPEAAVATARAAGLERVGDRWVPPALLATIADQVRTAVTRFHQAEPASPGISRETLRRSVGRRSEQLADAAVDRLAAEGTLVTKDGAVALAGFHPESAGGETAVRRVIELIETGGFEPPDTAELARALDLPNVASLVRVAVERGAVAAVERDRYYSRAALDRFVGVLTTIGATGEITPARVREATGASRKFLIPLLEWADRSGVTRRAGNVRVLVRNGRKEAS